MEKLTITKALVAIREILYNPAKADDILFEEVVEVVRDTQAPANPQPCVKCHWRLTAQDQEELMSLCHPCKYSYEHADNYKNGEDGIDALDKFLDRIKACGNCAYKEGIVGSEEERLCLSCRDMKNFKPKAAPAQGAR